ncbi:MAG: tetratricopeptide repeat protein [Gemmatimonadales bacterium]
MGSLNRNRASVLVVVGAALLAVLVFANSLANGFAYDDVWIIQDRDLVHGLGRLSELLTVDYWPPGFGSGLYRPFVLLTFAFDWWLWGGAPFGFHLVNVLLHAAVTAGLSALLLRFFPWWAALLGGVVYAVHPVHTEAVANVVGRAELLTALFVILACLVYVGAVRRHGRLSVGRVMAIAALYALAVLSKELGVVLPALLLVLDLPELARGKGPRLRSYVRARLPLLAALTAVLLGYLGMRWFVLGAPIESVPARIFIPDASLATRVFTMARVWPRYFQLLFIPTELSADYSPAVILPASQLTPLGALGIGLVVAMVVLAASSYRRWPELTVAVAWAAIALLPVSNLVFIAEIVLAERTLYLPSMAVSMIVAIAAVASQAQVRRWVVTALVIWVAGASFATVRRNPVWRDTETVFADIVEHHPESVRALWWLGDQRRSQGDWEGAKRWYYRSLEIWPYQAEALAEFAVYLNDHDDLAEAEVSAERAIALAPEHADNHILLSVIRLRQNDPVGALETVNRAQSMIGEHALFDRLRADAYEQSGRFAEAAVAMEASLSGTGTRPSSGDWVRLARLRAAAGDESGALRALDAAERSPGEDRALIDSLRAVIGRSP